MSRHATDPQPVLAAGAVYWSDNGRAICRACAGSSALFTGRDISGQKVERVDAASVRYWEAEMGRPMRCEMGCTTLSTVVGPDGWPLAREGGAR